MLAPTMLLAVYLLSFLLSIIGIKLGANWMGAGRATWKWAILAAIIAKLITVFANFLMREMAAIAFANDNAPAFMALGLIVAAAAITVWSIGRMLQLAVWRSFVVYLCHITSSLVAAALLFVVVRPYFLEAFTTPTNSMAPTLLGAHADAQCPKCGGRFVISATDLTDPIWPDGPDRLVDGICIDCQQFAKTPAPSTFEILRGDRFVVDKTRMPDRWDIALFRTGVDGEVYAFRVVGLPGEEVWIEDGAVWVNGERMQQPSHIAGIRYQLPEDVLHTPEWAFRIVGVENRHAYLSDGEYFLLGDFSIRSKDSRFLGPVAADDILGVVFYRYWPPSRWAPL